MTNIFAFRATDQKVMAVADDPVGPFNDEAIRFRQWKARLIISAWGSIPTRYRPRLQWQSRAKVISLCTQQVHCLATPKTEARSAVFVKNREAGDLSGAMSRHTFTIEIDLDDAAMAAAKEYPPEEWLADPGLLFDGVDVFFETEKVKLSNHVVLKPAKPRKEHKSGKDKLDSRHARRPRRGSSTTPH